MQDEPRKRIVKRAFVKKVERNPNDLISISCTARVNIRDQIIDCIGNREMTISSFLLEAIQEKLGKDESYSLQAKKKRHAYELYSASLPMSMLSYEEFVKQEHQLNRWLSVLDVAMNISDK